MKKRMMIVLLTALVLCLLAACGGGEMFDSAPAEVEAPRSTPAPAAAVAEEADSADFYFFEDAATADSDYFRLPILTPSNAGDRRLVYTVSMRLQTTEFLPGMRLLLNTVRETGGYLVSTNVQGSDLRRSPTERAAEFRFRVPTEQLEDFILVVENNYNIWNLQQYMQEETARYQQNAWGLDDLREQEILLVELLEDAEGDDAFWLSEELRGVRQAIRELEARQANIMSDVVYSTVDVQLFEAFLPQDNTSRNTVLWVFLGISALAFVVVMAVVVKKNMDVPKENSLEG